MTMVILKNPNNSTNALAVCNWCVTKHGGLSAAQVKPECCTSNRARLCRSHLAKCPNFHKYNTEEEIQRILALSVPEDNKKKCKEQSIESDEDEIEETSGFK
ncbi:hypothetical protein RhiirC2_797250 [Rhizophagus irregularis]|uniref:Uncharacterized protein n=1 Tax=Rhizophagus irregularis TaxID=588596 RepID=A0A2N1M8B1_9GLOM|nr:hypothetical protein RhiirC2_797250 [Rhizophagus irregularis]